MVCSQRATFFLTLLNNRLSFESSYSVKLIHAQLIKLSLWNTNTFLSNRCLELYAKVGTIKDALRAFEDIRHKNVFSWNIYMRVFISFGDIKGARQVFDEMPERDIVSWNSIISGYTSCGFSDCAFCLFTKMQASGVLPNGYTYSIVLSFVRSVHHGMEIHCRMVRSAVDFSSIIAGNSLINIYCDHGLVDYAFGVFLNMAEIDIVSWNSLIAGCSRSGYQEMAYKQFCIMRTTKYRPDAFTISSVLSACSSIQDFRMGEQIFTLSIQSGILSNTIVSSAAINMFSNCKRIDDSIHIFEEIDRWDSAVCNSMISSFIKHRLEEKAMQIFAISLNMNVKPNEFTLSSLVSCASLFLPAVQGTQLHCLVVKFGFDGDSIVSSSLVEMYSKCGFIDAAKVIFDKTGRKDLISWNTMILGYSYNGKPVESLKLFEDLLKIGQPPDEITLFGVLLACNHGRLIDEGLTIFHSMENVYGVRPTEAHFTFIVDMMIQANKLNEALNLITSMPYGLNRFICASILETYGIQGDLWLIERVAERLVELEPLSSLPYTVLAKAYEVRGRWESIARVKKDMKDRNIRNVIGCSWIGVKSLLFVFKENEVLQHGGEDVYSTLRLLMQDIEYEDYIFQ